ncbi:hypothetical protein BBJ28_00017140 [Nothophytophthora sp. Chile5]|nr:hypothetical protein BBJ28_00017140 [Nothophytophthora sp. Chile5]
MMSLRLLLLRRRSPALCRGISTQFDAAPRSLSASGQLARVVFGARTAAAHLGPLSRSSGIRKMLVVRDRDAGAAARTQYAEFLLMQAGVPCFQYTLEGDCPTAKGVDHAAATAQRVGADGVLAFGGGNAMDMARAVAVLMVNGGSAADYLMTDEEEEIKDAVEALETAPLLLMPTIAGSGAEMATQTLVLDEDEEAKLLFAAGSPIVADSYLLGCSDEATDALALEGMDAIAGALAAPLKEGKLDLKGASIREQFALGSLLSGMAANSSGCGAAQAMAVAMGGISDLPHTQVATAFLPFVFDRYTDLAVENEGDPFFDDLRVKLESAADRLTASSGFQGASVSAWLRYVISRFDLPTASTLELEDSLLNGLVDRAAMYQDESMEAARSDESGAILEKDDLRTIIDNAVLIAEPQTEDK